MKTLNPKTGEFYKRGDISADGRTFKRYSHVKYKHGERKGFFRLEFCSKEAFEKTNNSSASKAAKEKYRLKANGRSYHMLYNCKKRSEKLGLKFDLTKEWLMEKLNKGVCEITNEPFDFSLPKSTSYYNPYAPSVDKIDPKKGYTKDNCRIVLIAINFGMNEWGLETYLKIAKKALKNQ